MEDHQSHHFRNRNSNPRRSINLNNGSSKRVRDTETVNKILIICFICCFAFLPRTPTHSSPFDDDDRRVPLTFRRFPTVYFGSQVFLGTGFFSAFLGLMNSGKLRGERISRFCAVYSSICCALLLILLSSVALLPDSELPLWLKKRIYGAAIFLTNPLPLFSLLIILLPVILHFSLRHRINVDDKYED